MTAMEKIASLAHKKGPSAERIDIIHFDLAGNVADIPAGIPGTEVLVIFWRDDIPAGHAYVLRGRNGRISPIGLMGHVAPAGDGLQASGPSVKKTLSAVICTRDRPGALWRCLQSLSQLNTPPDQILVVDNASRDDAAEDIARTFGADYTREERPGLDYARNRGAREALGEIVAFVDDDVAVHPGWTERTIAAFDDPAVMAVTGLVLPAELETRAQIVFESQWGFGRGYARIDYRPDFLIASGQHIAPTWRIGAGANMAFRREIFDKVGYFDERLDAGAAGCGGDSEFWYRILARGWCCRYEPSSVVFHYHRRSERELANQIRA
jgi:GT2 family glycosyltransferase